MLGETGLTAGNAVFLTGELDAEGAGVGVHGIGDLDRLPLAPFAYRAVRSHLMPALGVRLGARPAGSRP